MVAFSSHQLPEIIFSALTGPGAALPLTGFPSYLYMVYSFPCYMYTGLPECIPKVNTKRLIQALEPKGMVKSVIQAASQVFLVREDDFVKSLWRGSLWPVVAMHAKVQEVFSEAAAFILDKKAAFISREAVTRWLDCDIIKGSNEEEAVSTATAWSYAEKACKGQFSSDLPIPERDKIRRRVEDIEFRKTEKERLDGLLRETKLSLPSKIRKEELNDLLISVRSLA